MSTPASQVSDITPDDIRTTLSKILSSREFAGSNRSSEFLRYVVEETLAGRQDRLKSFSIAYDVFERDEEFDPRVSTIVRVEAKRLRDHLTAYYGSDECDASIYIHIPKGGYEPVFEPIDAFRDAKSDDSDKQNRVFGSNRIMVGIALAFAALFVFIAIENDWIPGGSSSNASSVAADKYLVVLPLETLSNDPVENQLAAGMVEAVVTDLTKLSGLSVMAHASLLNLDKTPVGLDALKRNFGVTHALRGSLEYQTDEIRVNVQLVDIASGTTIWADRFDSTENDLLELQDIFAEQVISSMAIQITPEERTSLQRQHTREFKSLALYREALILMMPPNDLDRIISARHMFQRIVDIDDEFGGGYAGLSFTHSVSTLFFKSADPARELQLAIDLANQAIETDPQFGMGYVTLAFAQALSGSIDEALSNAERAVKVQPGDAFTQFVYGMCLTLSGRPAKALAPFSEALRLDPAEPRTPYRNMLGVAHLALRNYNDAARLFNENQLIGGPKGPHMDVFRAIAYAEIGELDRARAIVEDLNVKAPSYPVKRWIATWVRDEDLLTQSMQTLFSLGL